ncbi:MAG: solute carrier family 23 protein [Acetobacteraceae bacterium]
MKTKVSPKVASFGFEARPPLQGRLPQGMIYGVDDRPPASLVILAGLQWVGLINVYLVYLLVLSAESDLSPAVTAAMISASMLALGLAALLQALPRGPVGSGYLGPAVLSANYLGPSLAATKAGGLALLFGMTAFAGVFQLIISPLVRRRNIMPPEIAGIVVFLIGVTVGLIGMRYTFLPAPGRQAVEHLALVVSVATLCTAVGCTVWGKGALRMLSPLIGILVGYGISYATGLWRPTTAKALEGIGWVSLPSFGHISWSFDFYLALPFAIAAIAATVKTVGLIGLCQKLNDTERTTPDAEVLRRGVVADGLGTLMAGVFGTLGVNTMPSSVAIPAATGLASRRIAFAIAAIFAVLALVPGAAMCLALMPRPVVGALALYTGSFVMVNGLQSILSAPIDQKATIVIGLSVIAGLAAEALPQFRDQAMGWLQPITSSSLVLGTLVAFLTRIVLATRVGTILQNVQGRHRSVPTLPQQ